MDKTALAMALAFDPTNVVIMRSDHFKYHVVYRDHLVCNSTDTIRWDHWEWQGTEDYTAELLDWWSRHTAFARCNHCERLLEKAVWEYNSLKAGMWGGDERGQEADANRQQGSTVPRCDEGP